LFSLSSNIILNVQDQSSEEEKRKVSVPTHAKHHEVPNKSSQIFQSLHWLSIWKKLTAGLRPSNF